MKDFPKICTDFMPDEGYYFGLGVFETMLMKNGSIQLLDLHLKRMVNSAAALGMIGSEEAEAYSEEIGLELAAFLREKEPVPDNTVVKLAWSGERLFCSLRPNTYTEEQYERGFHLELSPVRRNETSLFSYHKTLNYGDNILEKRRAHREGFDEPVFLNSLGQVAEGATTNIFAVTEEGICTPPVEAGLLNGTVRQHLLKSFPGIIEKSLLPNTLIHARELFVTNALLGIMPVSRFGDKRFEDHEVAGRLRKVIFAENKHLSL